VIARSAPPQIQPQPFAAGMRLQLARLRAALAAGMPRLGWKIGINVPEVQKRAGLPHCGVGWLDGRQRHASGDLLRLQRADRLRAEAELAIRIGSDVRPSMDLAAARRCIAGVCPALEIVDYGLPGDGLEGVIAHSMFHAATVLGPELPWVPDAGLGVRWPTLRAGEREAAAPRRDLVAEDPAAIALFAAAYLESFGEQLQAGDWILSGSYMAEALPLQAGCEVRADFGALGAVHARIPNAVGSVPA
jgi:2-keto-4-pentenoate hydratase